MEAELTGWDFEQTRQAADQAWEKELGKVDIKSSSAEVMKIYYTALYHTMISPLRLVT